MINAEEVRRRHRENLVRESRRPQALQSVGADAAASALPAGEGSKVPLALRVRGGNGGAQ